MINIITRCDYNIDSSKYIEVNSVGNIITLDFYNKLSEDAISKETTSFDVSSLENYLYAIYLDNLDKFTPLLNTNTINARGGYSALQLSFNVGRVHPFVNVFRNGEEFFVLTYDIPVKSTNLEIIKVYDQCNTSEIVTKYCDEEFKLRKKIFSYKNKQINFQLEPLNTLAYLEPQVDILGKIFFTLLAKLDDSVKESLKQEIPELETIEQVFGDYSVLNIKSVDKCLEEMNTKAKVRRLQQDYYNYKAEIEQTPS